jgi:hypothetical protein
MRLKAVLVAFIFAATLSLAGAPAPDKPAGLDAIRAYEGTWTVNLQYLETPYSKASTDRNTLRNECWRNGAYFACNQYVNGESKVLLVFTYDASKNEYTSYQIPQGGAAPGSGKLLIDGNQWTYPWQNGQGGNTTYFRVVNIFTGPDKIEFRQEYSTDEAHWTLMGQGTETKKTTAK